MAESKVESMRRWVSEHKLRTVGCLWLSGITGSIAYNWSRPTMKTSVKLIHARLHAQALTLAALVGAAAIEYFDHNNAPTKNDPYANNKMVRELLCPSTRGRRGCSSSSSSSLSPDMSSLLPLPRLG